ncbi:hypothetical protein DL770_000986 [Monosporascus sp. CRB-9-2]|nr:hypothetical protein DL770_000986 [Monosporascus sp. CRB-9-2]
MVDTATYKQMHSSDEGKEGPVPNRDDIGPDRMSQDEPDLDEEFYMCLPTTIFGFNMQKKEWVTLEVGFIEDVTWNEEAFELLVIDEATKELVKAVVTNQLYAEDHADVIRGKGNCLFILLHGGPGTGKTLTAESVAEIAKKPLYKVTCGDIGTKAEEVEKLFFSWGRHGAATQANITLTLRYHNLEMGQRLQIWSNFIKRLEILERSKKPESASSAVQPRAGFGIDTRSIRAHLSELSELNLNGREIRNAISTARQLAMYKREPMGYDHLTRVINETRKFEDYIKELNRGFTADQIQKDKGER